MNKYEGMFIFSEDKKDEDVETLVGTVRTEIEKCGGRGVNATRLGRKPFARPLKKTTSGHYVVITFELPGEKLTVLQARLNLDEDVFRSQITRVIPKVDKKA